MAAITSLTLATGATAHVTAVGKDQHGNDMAIQPDFVLSVANPAVDSVAQDAPNSGGCIVTGVGAGSDALTATAAGGLTASLPITVTPEAQVLTSIVFTQP